MQPTPTARPQMRVVACAVAAASLLLLGLGAYFLAVRGDVLIGGVLLAAGIADAATAVFFARRCA